MMDERSTVICLINDCGFIIYLINFKYVPSSSSATKKIVYKFHLLRKKTF